jgi:DNA polymerase III alpha subunit
MEPKYEIIIYWSQEDDAYIAEVPELPGCTADGATYKQAVANVEVIIFPDLYATASHMLLTDTPLIVAGMLDRSEQGNKIKATRLHLLADVKNGAPHGWTSA